ncbi:hypothetical protein E2C01_091707 [Portunus trituberculatus]|uniref:Uncharacterized protein n=1 Tax=Portunus trituberculatus TaxID=210409 RepID=A0A5B7JTM9_PORTR|nr:hypothetical protein [Portunus trituberculatus]
MFRETNERADKQRRSTSKQGTQGSKVRQVARRQVRAGGRGVDRCGCGESLIDHEAPPPNHRKLYSLCSCLTY